MALWEDLMMIVDRIRDANADPKKQLMPTSDMIYKRMMSDIVDSDTKLKFYLRSLTEAHFLFTLHVVESDERLNIAGVDSYLAAEVGVLAALREKAYRELETLYEGQFYKRKQALVIIREMVPEAKKYNNTPFGKSLNVAVMLQQFEHLLTMVFHEYTETWKKAKLRELIPELGGVLDFESGTGGGISHDFEPSKRAVDSDAVAKLETMDLTGKWGAAVERYGVEFLLRIHFRKYEFDRVKSLIKQKKIAKEKDLKYVRETIRMMLDTRLDEDTRLKFYEPLMHELLRLTQMRINQILIAKKESGVDIE